MGNYYLTNKFGTRFRYKRVGLHQYKMFLHKAHYFAGYGCLDISDMMGIKLGFSHKWHFFAFLKWKCWSWVKYFALHLAMITSRLLYEPHWENIEMFCIDHLLLTSSAGPRGAWRDVSSNTTCSSPSSGRSRTAAPCPQCACSGCAATQNWVYFCYVRLSN